MSSNLTASAIYLTYKENMMSIVARNDVVILTRGEKINKTASGLMIATSQINQFGTVAALGENRVVNNELQPWDFAIGDQVVVGTNPMNTVLQDGVEYEFYRSKDILAIVSQDAVSED